MKFFGLYFIFVCGLVSCKDSHFLSMGRDLATTGVGCEHSYKTFNCVKYVSNYDGDTVTVNIPGLNEMFGTEMDIRVLGVDTPEVRPAKCGKAKAKKYNSLKECEEQRVCEVELGKEVKTFVAEQFQLSSNIQLAKVFKGKYFRVVADVIIEGESLSLLLLKKGFAIPYSGGTKPQINWCSTLEVESYIQENWGSLDEAMDRASRTKPWGLRPSKKSNTISPI